MAADMDWLVTGAGGFLGRAIVSALGRAHPRDTVLACDLGAPGCTDLDVTDSAAVEQALARHRPARVIHAAALTPAPDHDAAEAARVMRVNAGGSLAMIRACLATPPARLVLLSSAGVYAPGTQVWDETAPTRPEGAYAASKLASEEAACVWSDALDMICVRPGPLYGPGEMARSSRPRISLVGQMADALKAGEPFALAAPEAGRDWTHIDDAAEAIVALAGLETPPHRLFNITSGQRITNARLAAAFEARGLRVQWQDRPPQPHENDRPTVTAERLRAATGLTPRHDIASGIATL